MNHANFSITTLSSMAILLVSMYHSPLTQAGNDASSPWRYSLENTVRAQYYDNNGNQALSRYQSLDEQYYNELFLRASKRPSAYEKWDAQLFALANHSDYRGDEFGTQIENGFLRWQKGDAALPFRARVGDYYAFLSPRTLQKSLKGAQIEVQPKLGQNLNHSLLFFSGAPAASYNDFSFSQENYLGTSWLTNTNQFGSLSFNILRSEFSTSSVSDTEQEQTNFSINHHFEFQWLNQRLTTNWEIAHFDGFIQSLTTVNDEKEQDQSRYFRLQGRSGKGTRYSIRFEDNGAQYNPIGATVIADREAWISQFQTKTFGSSTVSLRANRYEDANSTQDSRKTVLLGARWFGSSQWFSNKRTGFNLDLSRQNLDSEQNTVDSSTLSFSSRISQQISKNINTTLQLQNNSTEDDINQSESDFTQVDLSMVFRFKALGFNGSFQPGIQQRDIEREFSNSPASNYESSDLGIRLNSQFYKQRQRVNFYYASFDVQPESDAGIESSTDNAGIQYSWSNKHHRISLSSDYRKLELTPQDRVEDYRISLGWTFLLEGELGRKQAAPSAPVSGSPISSGQVPLVSLLQPLNKITQSLSGLGIEKTSVQGNYHSYSMPGIANVTQKQQLVLAASNNAVTARSHIIDLQDISDAASLKQLLDQVLAFYTLKLGAPDSVHQFGEITDSFRESIRNEELIIVYDWVLNNSLVRLGIPKRLDNRIQIEVYQSRSMIPVATTHWGLQGYFSP